MFWRRPSASFQLLLILFCLALLATSATAQDWPRLINSDKEPQNWLSYGGNYSAHRYSALDQINRGNVKTLAPVWSFDTGDPSGLNATPIVMDGVLYLMGPKNRVFALKADTGEVLWKYF